MLTEAGASVSSILVWQCSHVAMHHGNRAIHSLLDQGALQLFDETALHRSIVARQGEVQGSHRNRAGLERGDDYSQDRILQHLLFGLQ